MSCLLSPLLKVLIQVNAEKYEKVDVNHIKGFIYDIEKAVNKLSEYLLDINGICLEQEFIYINEKGEVEFIYNPYGSSDFLKGLYELLQGVLPFIDHDNRKTVLIAYGLMDIMDTPNTNISDLTAYIAKVEEDEESTLKEESVEENNTILFQSDEIYGRESGVAIYEESIPYHSGNKKHYVTEGIKKLGEIIKKEKSIKEKSKYKDRPKLLTKTNKQN